MGCKGSRVRIPPSRPIIYLGNKGLAASTAEPFFICRVEVTRTVTGAKASADGDVALLMAEQRGTTREFRVAKMHAAIPIFAPSQEPSSASAPQADARSGAASQVSR